MTLFFPRKKSMPSWKGSRARVRSRFRSRSRLARSATTISPARSVSSAGACRRWKSSTNGLRATSALACSTSFAAAPRSRWARCRCSATAPSCASSRCRPISTSWRSGRCAAMAWWCASPRWCSASSTRCMAASASFRPASKDGGVQEGLAGHLSAGAVLPAL